MPSSATTPHKGLPQYLPDDEETREDVNRAYRIMDSIGAITQIGSPAYESKSELEAAFPDGDTKAYVADGIIYVWTGEWTSTGLDMSGYYTKPEVDGAFVALTDFEQAATFAQLTPGEATIISLGKLMKWFANPESFTPAFTQAGSLAQLVSGESLGTSLGKIMKVIDAWALAGTNADIRTALGAASASTLSTHMADLITDSDGAHGFRQYSGTWTPTLYGGTTPGTPTYTSRSGSYTRIGKLVLLQFAVQISAKGGMAGAVFVGGLPFSGSFGAVNFTNTGGLSLPTGSALTSGVCGGTFYDMQRGYASGASQVQASEMTDSFVCYSAAGWYIAT